MSDDPKISLPQVLNRLKRIIAEDKNWPWNKVRSSHRLRDDPLSYADSQVGGLATDIKKRFRDVELSITPGDVREAVTVKDLTYIVWEKIPEKYRR